MKNTNLYSNQLEELLKTGIYKITCKVNNKVYIGSASSFKSKQKSKLGFFRRWEDHIRKLESNKHSNRHLQFAWTKYGKSNFKFEILEVCSPEMCIEREMYYIDEYDCCNHTKGFNIINQANLICRNFSADHRRKISESLVGRKRPLDIVKKWSNKVQQIDKKTGQIIAEFYSMSEASRQTGIQRQDIGQSIIGKKCKSAGGYYWKKIKT